MKAWTTFLLILAAASSLLGGTAQAAQSGERCFPETGFCISGAIRTYWEGNGGLPVFGYPISEEHREVVEGDWMGPVQWFERDRLEDHANEGKGILAGRLGVRRFGQLYGTEWNQLPADNAAQAGCRYFAQTHFNMCEPFLSYWQNNGGLARFGYPITRQRQEAVEGTTYTVQYFERRRMELHPENAGTPYEVLLGLLGRDLYGSDSGAIMPPVGSNDLSSDVQQTILNAAWTMLKPHYPQTTLMLGLVDQDGAFAIVHAVPNRQQQRPQTVLLQHRGAAWLVLEATSMPSSQMMQRYGVPAKLWQASDASAIIDDKVLDVQTHGAGLNGYITRPCVSGDYARFSLVPAVSTPLDPATVFYKRQNGAWHQLTAGTAFPEDDLRALGIPQDLWTCIESVHGPDA